MAGRPQTPEEAVDAALRAEVFDVEVKREWWDFTRPAHLAVPAKPGQKAVRAKLSGKDEFRRDIVGMANAHFAADGPRFIVVGVSGKKVFPAPFPLADEAELQNLLRKPRPSGFQVRGCALAALGIS
jgi:hypothetical protein